MIVLVCFGIRAIEVIRVRPQNVFGQTEPIQNIYRTPAIRHNFIKLDKEND